MNSYITATLIILILLVLLVVFIPAVLDRLARRNVERRDLLAADIKKMERDARRFERLFVPYKRLQSAAYRSAAKVTEENISLFVEEISQLGQLHKLVRCPAVYGYLLPVQHFVTYPNHISIILKDLSLLNKAAAQQSAAQHAVTDINNTFEALALLPKKLRGEKEALTGRLADLEAIVRRERTEGIEALDDFMRDVAGTSHLLELWEQSAGSGASVTSLDEGAVALETASATLTDAFGRAANLERERIALDRRIQRITTQLDDAQVVSKSGPAAVDSLPQVRPLLRRAALLLNESAPDHRRRREFNAAGADVSTAAQLIAFSRDLVTADSQVRLLRERDDGVSLTDAIGVIRQELTELMERMGLDRGEPQDGLIDTSLAAQAAKVRTRSETLVRQQDEVIAQLTREATSAKEQLEKTWEMGQRLLPLAENDPLFRRYTRLMAQFQEAQRQPNALERYRQEIGSFGSVWTPWVARVRAARERIIRIRAMLPDLIDRALELAGPWNCLADDVGYIQQRAADFETTQAHFSTVNHRREAEGLMEQLEAIERDINERFAKLNEKAGRLQFLEKDISQIIALVSDTTGNLSDDYPDKPKWERTLRLIDHHTRSAHAAQHYEDASVALLRAADAANKLVI